MNAGIINRTYLAGLALALTALCAAGFQEPTFAASYEIVDDESVFAIITYRSGLAGALAHNHFIVAGDYTVDVTVDDGPESLQFHLKLPTASLAPDVSETREQWAPRLAATDVLDEKPSELSESDLTKIRKSMLGPEQLDAERFPDIQATLKELRARESSLGNETFYYESVVAVKIHGQWRDVTFPSNVESDGETLRVEAVGTADFTEFGIEPYSAFLGAVRVQDEFRIFVHFVARPPAPAEDAQKK